MMQVGEQQGNDVFAVAAIFVEARTGCIGNARLIQFRLRPIIGRICASAFAAQHRVLNGGIRDRAFLKIFLAAPKTFRAGSRANYAFRDFRYFHLCLYQLLVRIVSCACCVI